ncbi:MAG: hypothetical protein IKQ71_08905 [Lachnospiraceae bacterium]|nr:hypothetical protein [Lachnospiraceae bacterium]
MSGPNPELVISNIENLVVLCSDHIKVLKAYRKRRPVAVELIDEKIRDIKDLKTKWENTMSERKKVKNMCEVLDKVEARGEARGKAIGRVRALYYDADFSIDEIVKKTELSAEEIEEMIALDDEE